MDNSGQNSNIIKSIFKSGITGGSSSPSNPFNSKIELQNFAKPVKRLNGYDSAILNKVNSPQNEEQELNIEYRIREKEAVLKDLDNKIAAADKYGSQSESLGLKAKRQRIAEELSSLYKQQMYGGRVLGDNDFLRSKKENMSVIDKAQDFISRNILAKVSKKVNSFVALSDSLEQLSEISKSVDELIDMNIPYGEKGQSYEKLTQYLSKANAIHSRISKSLR